MTEWCERGADRIQNTKEDNHVISAEHSSYNIDAQMLSSLEIGNIYRRIHPRKACRL